MKKKYLFMGVLAVGMLTLAGCDREHQCKCTYSTHEHECEHHCKLSKFFHNVLLFVSELKKFLGAKVFLFVHTHLQICLT